LSWYQHQPDQFPRVLIYETSTWVSGVSTRFSGGHSGTDFTFRICNVEKNDVGTYYCLVWPGCHSDTSLKRKPLVFQRIVESAVMCQA
jgi:hypothetical protein